MEELRNGKERNGVVLYSTPRIPSTVSIVLVVLHTRKDPRGTFATPRDLDVPYPLRSTTMILCFCFVRGTSDFFTPSEPNVLLNTPGI